MTLAVDEPIPDTEIQEEEEKEKMSTGTIVLIILLIVSVNKEMNCETSFLYQGFFYRSNIIDSFSKLLH